MTEPNDPNDLEAFLNSSMDEMLASLPTEALQEESIESSPSTSAIAPPAATSSTRSGQSSMTLSALSGPAIQCVCTGCPAGVWYMPEAENEPRVYCRLMHRNMEKEKPILCDGKAIAFEALQG